MPRADTLPQPTFTHLRRLTSRHGLLEHAKHDEPLPEHGLCTDDNARALVVLGRTDHPPVEATEVLERSLGFVERGAVDPSDGRSRWHNRMDIDGRWTDAVGSDDCHGQALWGLGIAAATAPSSTWRDRAEAAFVTGSDFVSPFPRSCAFAILGATAAITAERATAEASQLLERSIGALGRPRAGSWRWPEDRLTYANARIPEAMIIAGSTLGDRRLLDDGIELLNWLVEVESTPDHFSFTPVGGRGPDDPTPGFDQQPIEAWAMADACATAADITGDAIWEQRRRLAVAWFLGTNDVGAALYDEVSGAGYDGLTPDGVNDNRGAESTLAALGALLSSNEPVAAGPVAVRSSS